MSNNAKQIKRIEKEIERITKKQESAGNALFKKLAEEKRSLFSSLDALYRI